MKSYIKRRIIRELTKRGYVKQHNLQLSMFSMEACLLRCIERGLEINTVIDIGASNGCWSEMCIKHLPNANFFMIEAQEPHKKDLERFKNNHRNSDFIISAAGSRVGSIYFDNSDLFGGLALEEKTENCIEVPVTTIDHEVILRKLPPPYLIKLDTHGFEVPILEGAINTLKKTNLLIIETYNYKITSDSLRYFEMNKYMEDLQFSSIEIADLMLRLKDNSFWQMDTFYIPSNRKEFTYNSYK